MDLGTSYLNKYHQSGMPQQAYSVGLDYRDPNYWWVSTNVNYLRDSYITVSPLLRTDNFFINPEDQSQFPFQHINPDTAKKLLQQEKLNPQFTINLLGGKTWRIARNTLGVFIIVNNLLNQTYRIGGFESSRNANYSELLQSQTAATPSFGNNYAYSFGRTYFMNIYCKM